MDTHNTPTSTFTPTVDSVQLQTATRDTEQPESQFSLQNTSQSPNLTSFGIVGLTKEFYPEEASFLAKSGNSVLTTNRQTWRGTRVVAFPIPPAIRSLKGSLFVKKEHTEPTSVSSGQWGMTYHLCGQTPNKESEGRVFEINTIPRPFSVVPDAIIQSMMREELAKLCDSWQYADVVFKRREPVQDVSEVEGSVASAAE
jgi:hypothetical protein